MRRRTLLGTGAAAVRLGPETFQATVPSPANVFTSLSDDERFPTRRLAPGDAGATVPDGATTAEGGA